MLLSLEKTDIESKFKRVAKQNLKFKHFKPEVQEMIKQFGCGYYENETVFNVIIPED